MAMKSRRAAFLFVLSSIFSFLAHATRLQQGDGLDASAWVISHNGSFLNTVPSSHNISLGLRNNTKVSRPQTTMLDDPDLIFCYESLQAADKAPQDLRITSSEFFTFVGLQTAGDKHKHQSFADLELKYISMFYSQACLQCSQPNCCIGKNAHIHIHPRRRDFAQTLSFLSKGVPRAQVSTRKKEPVKTHDWYGQTMNKEEPAVATPGDFRPNLQCPVV